VLCYFLERACSKRQTDHSWWLGKEFMGRDGGRGGRGVTMWQEDTLGYFSPEHRLHRLRPIEFSTFRIIHLKSCFKKSKGK
jgi:hypothetical protein